ncbi:MAG: hypothetical protein KF795_32745 [Labilithrix sp.]|nr:hypothetical protein [Labilithrix sp.]
MSRFGSSVAVLALKTAIAVGGILCAAGCAPQTSGRVNRHVVPSSLAHVALEDFDVVSFVDVDLHTAVQTRAAVESEFSSAYGHAGHPRWFFHSFDGSNLDFVVARFEPTSAQRSRYVAQQRLRVKRSRAAERALGVADVVRDYEVGTRGVKAGMSRREATAVAGRPQSWIPRSEKGSFDLLYPTFCVRFTGGKVAHVWRRDQCSF